MILNISGEMTEATVPSVIDVYNQTQDDNAVVYLSSIGGSMESMIIIKDVIESCPLHTTVVGYGFLGSAAFLMFYALRADKKILLPLTIGMTHQASMEVPILSRTTTDLERFSRKVMKMDYHDFSNEIYDLIGMSNKYIKDVNSGKDVLFTPAEMVAFLETSNPKTCRS